jgi:DNA primase
VSASNAGQQSADYKSLVLAAVDLVDLVGRSVALKRKGKDYWGLCPFHQEKSGSFKVSPERQFFYCFGCKAMGNAIDFVMRRDRVEFLDALRSLGEAYNVEMPKFGVSKQRAGERQALYEANAAACMFFEKLLADPQAGAAARAYLAERQINAESVKRFRVGLAPDAWDGLLRGPVGRKFSAEELHRAGLVKKRERGDGYYDTFRNRLMFPIRDETGRTIAFGGRVMPGSQDPAKYLNSPETDVFSKSRCVFGLDLARQKIVETRTAVVVEGYTDVIVAHQFGVSNVVSPLGTALTEQHVSVLKRFADRIVLLFDADAAGDTAVDRTVGLFLTQPVEIAIASMPEGTDPDEYLLKEGAEAFGKLLAGAPDALTYKWKQLSRKFNSSNDLTGQQRAVEEYLSILADARGSGPVDGLRWGAALSRVSRLTGIPVEDLNRRFRAPKVPARQQLPAGSNERTPAAFTAASGAGRAPQSRLPSAQLQAERWILGILLLEPRRWHKAQRVVSVADFSDETHRRLAEAYWDHQRNEGEPVFNEFLGFLKDPSLVELAVEAIDEVDALADPERVLAEALAHLEAARQFREQQKLVADLRRSTDEPLAEQDEVGLLRQLQEKARRPDLRRT